MDLGFWLLDELAKFHINITNLGIESYKEIEKQMNDSNYSDKRFYEIIEESKMSKITYEVQRLIFKLFYE